MIRAAIVVLITAAAVVLCVTLYRDLDRLTVDYGKVIQPDVPTQETP